MIQYSVEMELPSELVEEILPLLDWKSVLLYDFEKKLKKKFLHFFSSFLWPTIDSNVPIFFSPFRLLL
jgi:hypothetical protein